MTESMEVSKILANARKPKLLCSDDVRTAAAAKQNMQVTSSDFAWILTAFKMNDPNLETPAGIRGVRAIRALAEGKAHIIFD